MRRALGLGIVAMWMAVGCAEGARNKNRAEGLEQVFARIQDPAYRCAPEELARAEVHLEAGRYQTSRGALFRAQNELEQSWRYQRRAEDKAAVPSCALGTSDRDGDAVLDERDQCIDDPEDRDNFQDEDGCPDPDNDLDGLADVLDRCPDQPEDRDGFQDEDGCPDFDDRDKDGVADDVDKCPDVPEDRDGFADEDGCPDPDNDLDGLADASDKCPVDPEDADGFEDADGCPDIDNDQDGIADAKDACPDRAEDYDGDADEDGCPDVYEKIVLTTDQITLKDKVHFQTGKAVIQSESYGMLNEVVDVLKAAPAIVVRIEGHTDSVGRDESNLRLSMKRANAVRTYLLSKGINKSRLTAEGFGEDRPLESNEAESGRAVNRRVEFHIVKSEPSGK